MDQVLRLPQRHKTDKPTASEPLYFKLLFKKNRKQGRNEFQPDQFSKGSTPFLLSSQTLFAREYLNSVSNTEFKSQNTSLFAPVTELFQ